MKKLGLYLFLAAALFVTGCSQKESSVQAPETAKNSDSKLNKVAGDETYDDMTSEDSQSGVWVEIDGEKVFLRSIHFAFNKFDITSQMRKVIVKNAALLSKHDGKIVVEGNCDEWGTEEYNYALGLKRANAVQDALIAEGLNAKNISLVSYGENNPVCEVSTEQCWAKNRRASFKLQ